MSAYSLNEVPTLKEVVEGALVRAAKGFGDPVGAVYAARALEGYEQALGRVPYAPALGYEYPRFELHLPFALLCALCGGKHPRAFRPGGEAMRLHTEVSGHDRWQRETRWPWNMPAE